MGMITVSKIIDAPLDRVFEVFTDLPGAPGRVSAIMKLEVLTDGPIGMGTRFRETRVMFKKEATETMEFIDFDPPRSYTVEANSCGCHYETSFRFEPHDGGTKVTAVFSWQARSFMAKLMSPLGKLMGSMCIKAFNKDLGELKAHCEQLQPA